MAALWLHWGRLATLRRSSRIRRSLSLWQRFLHPHAHSVFLGRANYRHSLRVPLEEHLLNLVAGIGRVVQDHQAALTRLTGPLPADPDADDDLANPAPKWWKLPAGQRREPLTRLRAWVEQVYRPGYGHLAAALGQCWEAHDLCLYGLDILAELWSALYLRDHRSPGLLSAQAEYQVRLLPALSAQFMTETTGCGHARPANVRVRSAS